MKTLQSIAGKTYVITSPNGCTVTDETGLTLGTVDAGQQKVFIATGAKLQADDDSARITATFNSAPAKLRLLGLLGGGSSTGGGSALPAGYLQAEFVSTQKQIVTEYIVQYAAVPQTANVKFYIDSLGSGYRTVFGWYFDESYLYRIMISANNNKVVEWRKNAAGDGSIGGSFVAGEMYDFKLIPPTVVVNGESLEMKVFGNSNKEVNKPVAMGHSSSIIRYYNVEYNYNDATVMALKPALSSAGLPVLRDIVNNTDYNNETMRVGLSLTQARKLKLPETGGSLKLSLPMGYDSDEGVANALETARANGWTLTIQTYEAETAASTFGMRRIWVRKTQDENGMYVDATGTRWQVDWCVAMYTPDGSTPDMHGYELFRSVDAAVAYWELTPWVDPEAEQMMQDELLTNGNTND